MAPKRRNLDEDVSRTKKKKPNGKSTTNKTSLSPTQTATTGNTPAQEKSDQAHTSSQTATIVAAVIQELEDRGVIPKKQTVSNNGHIINCHHELQVPNHITNANQPQMEILDDATNVVQSVLQLPGMPNPQVSPRTMNGTPRQDHTGILPVSDIHSYSISPSAMVDIKIKQAIWNNEFIEFAELLSNRNTREADNLIQFKVGQQNVEIVPRKTEKKMLNIGQWLSAFHVFLDIYKIKYPEEVSALLAYCNLIRDLERVYGTSAFQFYDRNFRAHRQFQPLPWGNMHPELWIKATTLSAPQQRHVQMNKTCINYNKPQGCSYRNCRYEHKCGHCFKSHPKFKCFQLIRNTEKQQAVPSTLSSHNQRPQVNQKQPPVSFRNTPANSNK
jgi:hypothetical protein